MFRILKEDIQAVFARDPAAKSLLEVIFCYPGLHAIWLHRIAHWFWRRKLLFLGRFISHINRFLTGVEIHPGAKIGRRFFIDHGMGIVIGETAEIGDDVLLYTGVVLGGTSLEKIKRHPTIGNKVVISTRATFLGAITIGEGSKIGSGSVVIKPVPPGTTVVGVPGRVVEPKVLTKPVVNLEHGRLPDPVAHKINTISEKQHELEKILNRVEKTMTSLKRISVPVSVKHISSNR